ncbi:sugar-binding protein [Halosimplex aquaticum]
MARSTRTATTSSSTASASATASGRSSGVRPIVRADRAGARGIVHRDRHCGRRVRLESDAASVEFTTTEAAESKATIPRTPTRPTVDGTLDDVWQRAEPKGIDVLAWGDQASDISAEWRALWDEEALYVFVSVADGTLQKADAVEVFLDLDNSRGDSYDGEDDLQLVMIPGIKQAWQGPNSATSDPVFVRTDDTDEGWRVELSVPWESYDVTPLTGLRFGMDVHVADDLDDDDDRDAKHVWHDESDRVWEVPAKLATVELGE